MATVYLPFGYPLIEGQEFETIIYQGNVARKYVIPTDPRTDAQLFQRRLFSDLVKMRTTMGWWCRGAAKTALGSKWGTVFYQLVKADDGGRWTDAINAWEDLESSVQEEWRQVAPYQATFNDPGKVFFLVVNLFWQLLNSFSGVDWMGQNFEGADYEDALAWWQKDNTADYVNTKSNEDVGFMGFAGNWSEEINAGDYVGSRKQTSEGGNTYVEQYWYGRLISVGYRGGPTMGTVNIWIDGVSAGDFSETMAIETAQQSTDQWDRGRGLHHVKLQRASGTINIDFWDVE